MSVVREPEVAWSPEQMVEVVLSEPDDFLKVRETLTRIGVASRKEKKIYQSCHILHKQGRYYLVHLIGIVDVEKIQDIAPLNQIKVLAYKDKADWILETKYNIGSKKKRVEETE